MTIPGPTQAAFISLEGIDGAGKSTHLEAVAQALREQGHDVLVTREPGGTPLAEKLRTLLLHDPMDALTEALLVFAARRDHLQRVIEPALAQGRWVVCDRFTDATFAYQGHGRGFDLQQLATLERWVQSNATGERPRQPHLTLWFDVPPEVAAQRLSTARSPDKFESESTPFFARVAQGYAQRCANAPERFARIDGNQVPTAVWQQVQAVLQARGWLA